MAQYYWRHSAAAMRLVSTVLLIYSVLDGCRWEGMRMLSTFRRRQGGLLAFCAAGLLVGCVMEGGGSAPTSVSVGDQITVAGPSGYCVDTSASRTGDSGAFVLLGSCASISRSLMAARPKYPAILTASVSGGGTDTDTF